MVRHRERSRHHCHQARSCSALVLESVYAKFLSSPAALTFSPAHCPEFVQTALNLCIAERFRFGRFYFHTVFNRTVENSYKHFIFSPPFNAGMVSKVPWHVFSNLFWKVFPVRGPAKKFARGAR